MNLNNNRENENNECTSLYIGNLSLRTVESDLARLFQSIGPVLAVKIIKPTVEGKYNNLSCCYAYVTYRTKEEADAAILKLNFYELHGLQMRVMFCDKNNFGNVEGNIVIKNLPISVDDRTLYATFSVFGPIFSCKVANSHGKSLGYGYVQYETKKSAKKAIKIGAGLKMGNNVLIVEKYEKRQSDTDAPFTNVYVKNFPLNISEEDLKKVLLRFGGHITSFCMPNKEDGTNKGFAFCDFKSFETAKTVIERLHNEDIFGLTEKFYVQRAQPKSEREVQLRSTIAKLSTEGKSFKRNLYITNIPDQCGPSDVKSLFERYGPVVSVKVEKDTRPAQTTNYAMVCFMTPEAAASALAESRIIALDGNRLAVSLFKSRPERENDKESSAFIYNTSSVAMYPRIKSGQDKKPEGPSDSQVFDDIYRQVYILAPAFKDMWPIIKAKDFTEFSNIITRILMRKSRSDINNMIELTDVLTENVSEAIRKYDSENSKNIF